METAIQIVWWIGLIGALAMTLVILKQVLLILQTLKGIHRLAEVTREAAQGVADNLAAGTHLEDLKEPARTLRKAAGMLASAVGSIDQKLDALAEDMPPRGG